VLLLDLGARTEISLLHKGRHLVCSCDMQNAPDIRAGVIMLMREAAIEAEDIDLTLVASDFDTTLDLADYQINGLLLGLPLNPIQLVGNAAGSGACELLLSTRKRAEAESMPEHIESVELSTNSD
jgi:uncharacterized 2Fe-2S/4Fe-4S cluster protein (DUF4445 family)